MLDRGQCYTTNIPGDKPTFENPYCFNYSNIKLSDSTNEVRKEHKHKKHGKHEHENNQQESISLSWGDVCS